MSEDGTVAKRLCEHTDCQKDKFVYVLQDVGLDFGPSVALVESWGPESPTITYDIADKYCYEHYLHHGGHPSPITEMCLQLLDHCVALHGVVGVVARQQAEIEELRQAICLLADATVLTSARRELTESAQNLVEKGASVGEMDMELSFEGELKSVKSVGSDRKTVELDSATTAVEVQAELRGLLGKLAGGRIGVVVDSDRTSARVASISESKSEALDLARRMKLRLRLAGLVPGDAAGKRFDE